jgi:hypothetical protein
MAKQPIHSIRFGYIKANIWFNQTKSGDRHNVTVTRLYKDGDIWRESQHFGRDDLLLLAKVLDQVHTWIMQQVVVSEPTCSVRFEGGMVLVALNIPYSIRP